MHLEIFKYQSEEETAFNMMRTIEEDGKVLFCATDVAKMLGYKKPNDAVSTHCRYAVKHSIPHPQNKSKNLEVLFIPEGDVYRLIVRSKLPSAERFEKWLFDEVVPSISKKGYYGSTGKDELPEFVKRYKANLHTIPSDYFSVISELFVRLYAEFEKVGYLIPDKAVDGKTMMPDGSVGKLFARFLREHHSDLWDKHKTYKHHFPDGRKVDALMYPIEALPMFIRYVNERWLFNNAQNYFKTRDQKALDYLPKLLESKKKTA